jgi:hypothetical protein
VDNQLTGHQRPGFWPGSVAAADFAVRVPDPLYGVGIHKTVELLKKLTDSDLRRRASGPWKVACRTRVSSTTVSAGRLQQIAFRWTNALDAAARQTAHAFARTFALTLLALSSATYIALTRRCQRTNVAARRCDFGQKGLFCRLANPAVSRTDRAAHGRVWYRRIQNFFAYSSMQSSKTGLKRPIVSKGLCEPDGGRHTVQSYT